MTGRHQSIAVGFSLPLFGLVLLAGCADGSAVEIGQVSGVVLVDGRPAENLEIIFTPPAAAGEEVPPASAISDAKGHFVLRTGAEGNAGVAVGKHRVLVRDLQATPEATWNPNNPNAEPEPQSPPPRSRVPGGFQDAQRTPLQGVEVRAGEQEIEVRIDARRRTGEVVQTTASDAP